MPHQLASSFLRSYSHADEQNVLSMPDIITIAGGNATSLPGHGRPVVSPDIVAFWTRIGISTALVFTGGIFAGLTLGLMGLDELRLRVLAECGEERDRINAGKVLALLNRGRHWVLVVLLLCNVVVNESLPIFLDSAIGGGIAAIVISTVVIVIFGEIIPQAVCVRYGLSIGAACAPGVLCLMWLFAPIAWPIAKLLDRVLGHKTKFKYSKTELQYLLELHREGEDALTSEEYTILHGIIQKKAMPPV